VWRRLAKKDVAEDQTTEQNLGDRRNDPPPVGPRSHPPTNQIHSHAATSEPIAIPNLRSTFTGIDPSHEPLALQSRPSQEPAGSRSPELPVKFVPGCLSATGASHRLGLRVLLEEVSDDVADASALTRGLRPGAIANGGRNSDPNTRGMFGGVRVQEWPASARSERRRLESGFGLRRQPVEVCLRQHAPALGRHRHSIILALFLFVLPS
jgi:hypothetical protein